VFGLVSRLQAQARDQLQIPADASAPEQEEAP
jgi:hypothetical protein